MLIYSQIFLVIKKDLSSLKTGNYKFQPLQLFFKFIAASKFNRLNK